MSVTQSRITLAAACIIASLFTSSLAAQQSRRWVVVFNQQNSLSSRVQDRVAKAGGTILAAIPEIGAVAVTSPNADFDVTMSADPSVASVSEDVELQLIPSADQLHVQFADPATLAGGPAQPPGSDLQTGSEPYYFAQWDKKRMRASNQGSYAIQQGRPEVVVAVLDTGADILPFPHLDITPHLDFARSRAFFPVQPDPNGDPNPAVWDDKNGHGSWCLSAVGAPINGIGMSGVAPRVTLVALKVLGDNGTGSLFALAQALVYAGNNKFDVASMSIGAYLRHADHYQALATILQRAVNYARQNGVTPVAALGNESYDLSDGSSFHDIFEWPAEIDGIIGVSATGYANLKASYSNYGMGKTDVSAPGGDFAVQVEPIGGGSVLGAWATEQFGPNSYAFASGTSMACPNAAGVVALIISQYGDFTPDNSRKAHMSPQAVEAVLQRTANNQPCPDPNVVNYYFAFPVPPFPAGAQAGNPDQRCQGEAGGYTSFYGKGIVDAFKAVTNTQ